MVNGTQIRAAREAAGLSRAKLAAKLGIAQHTVYRWEHGIHSRLSFDTVRDLAAALGVPAEQLVGASETNGANGSATVQTEQAHPDRLAAVGGPDHGGT